MYILIVASGYPTDKYRGIGIFEFDQAKALAEAGHKIIYAAVDVRSIRRWRKWGFESFEKEGVTVEAINIPGGRIPKRALNLMQTLGFKSLYNRVVKKHGKPDIVHAHFTGPGYVAAKLKNQISLPLVITEHSSAINRNDIDRHLFNTAGFAYENADALIAVSSTLKNIIKDKFGLEVIYIPNIVDTDLFVNESRRQDYHYNFISVGNLILGKRMDLTIEAFYNAFKDQPNIRLTIFGEGPERTKLENMINQYELSNRITLMGMQPREIIADHLRSSNCFVLASRTETFGVAYAEALAAGVPVIATRCGGPEEFVHEENGVLIEVDDAKALTNAMLEMYNTSNRFDKEKISKEIIEKFSPQAIAEQLTDVYCGLLNMRYYRRG